MYKRKEICARWQGEHVLSLTMNGVIIRNLDNPSGKMPTTFDGYQFIKEGTLLLCLFDIDVTPRCVGRVFHNGVTSPAYSNFIMKKGYWRDFYYYYFLMLDNSKELLHMAKNLRHSFTEEQLGIIPVPCPNIIEQKTIASFLDTKCAEIDALVEDIKAEITTLEEYKKSLITETVTKGLNPDVELKDSGVETIGRVPSHWRHTRLKYLCQIQTGNEDTQNANPEGEYPFYVRSPIIERCKRYTFEGEGILVAGDGAGAGRVFHHVFGKYAVHQRVYRLSEFSFPPRFIYYWLSCLFPKEMDKGSAQSTVPSMRLPMLQNFVLYLPLHQEAEYISRYIDTKCSEIDTIISVQKKQLTTLNEYKKSLIYEYVTGKKEVPQP